MCVQFDTYPYKRGKKRGGGVAILKGGTKCLELILTWALEV